MKDLTPLKVFNFSHPLIQTEWLSIIGDKYSHSLPFKIEVVDDFKSAQVILWDGVITAKNQKYIELFFKESEKKMFFILGESMTFTENNPLVKIVDLAQIQYVEATGWSVLPEDILLALQSCYKKLNHV